MSRVVLLHNLFVQDDSSGSILAFAGGEGFRGQKYSMQTSDFVFRNNVILNGNILASTVTQDDLLPRIGSPAPRFECNAFVGGRGTSTNIIRIVPHLDSAGFDRPWQAIGNMIWQAESVRIGF